MFEEIILIHMLTNDICFLGDDILIHQDKENPNWRFILEITEDGRYLVMFIIKDSAWVRCIYCY